MQFHINKGSNISYKQFLHFNKQQRTGNSKVCWLTPPIIAAVYSKKSFIISTIICKTVRGQNDPMLGVDVFKNTLGVRGLKVFHCFFV
jgi:hypothetical protein